MVKLGWPRGAELDSLPPCPQPPGPSWNGMDWIPHSPLQQINISRPFYLEAHCKAWGLQPIFFY